MEKIDFKKIIKKYDLSNFLNQGNFGIEKENLRTDEFGNLALTDFPKIFGDKGKNPYITVDFSESQIEMITPTFDKIEKTYNFLKNLNDIVTTNLKNEYLWPQSLPCIIPSEDKVPIAKYEEEREEYKYRKHLAKKYGKNIQLISGIHYNFSFSKEFLNILYEKSNLQINFKEFKNQAYLKVVKNFFKDGWIITYLLGASSPVHKSFLKNLNHDLKILTDDIFYEENTVSFRNGKYGYKNQDSFFVSYDCVEDYVSDIEDLVNKKILTGAREYYSPIRLKSKSPKNILTSLLQDGIEYLEFRTIDLNPFSEVGINIEDLKFIHLLIKYFLIREENETFFEKGNIKNFLKNHELIAQNGKNKNLEIDFIENSKVKINEHILKIIDEIKFNLLDVNLFSKEDEDILEFQRKKILDSKNLYVNKLLSEVKNKGYVNFHLNKAKKYLEKSKKEYFSLKGYENLELSTQILIKEIVKRGINFEILDEKENFIFISKDGHEEYIRQATKTSLDSYITVLIMENKIITKKVLEKNNISVPSGNNYNDSINAINDFFKYKEKAIVIKPKSTNFGLGISIFKESFSLEEYKKGVNFAFKEDNSILIEEFIEGREYRFFVIGDEVVGILHRVPANVKGDGKSNIYKLVEEKNKNPLRGKGYRTPLEKISLGEAEELFLKNQNKNFDYIPKKDEIVYLRENSNISTGGDSIDYTDDVLEIYKKIAVDSAKAVKANFCGVDMMIKDIKNPNPQGNYSIIELNFNPAIHIHCYPLIGKNRGLAEKILDFMGY